MSDHLAPGSLGRWPPTMPTALSSPELLTELRELVERWRAGNCNRLEVRYEITRAAIRYCAALEQEEAEQ